MYVSGERCTRGTGTLTRFSVMIPVPHHSLSDASLYLTHLGGVYWAYYQNIEHLREEVRFSCTVRWRAKNRRIITVLYKNNLEEMEK